MSDITSLTQEEMDCINYDAREGDLTTLKAIFEEVPANLLLTIKDENTLSTPVHMAAGNGHVDVVRFLLSLVSRDDAVRLASQANDEMNTPLHWAAFNGHLEVVKCLCEEYDVDVYARNHANHDAMFEAENNQQQLVEHWLLEKYAVEDDFNVEQSGENTKITYKPGTETKEADEYAAKAVAENKPMEEVAKSTSNLNI